ncbi:MAG: flagellar export protein FliJ [Clostridium sp.]|uniref:flagellar export protein FliJ n=1 Tax=Clostridium sp. TaxID=1506 RepID=UPI002FC72885
MFNFKLDKVLDYREKIEKKSKENFAAKLRIYSDINFELESLVTKKTQVLNGGYSNLRTTQELIVFQRYLTFLDDSIDKTREELSVAERILEGARVEVIKANKDRKVIETLKDNAYIEHIKEENKLEQNKLDDIASNNYIKSLKGGD